MTFAAIWPTSQANNFGPRISNKYSLGNQNKAVGSIAQSVRDIAKTLAAHGLTGNLARSLYAKQVSDNTWDVGSPLNYAWPVEFGSGVFGEGPTATHKPIEPVKGEFLAFKIDGNWIRVRYVLGQHPQPFLRPAVEQVDSQDAAKGAFG